MTESIGPATASSPSSLHRHRRFVTPEGIDLSLPIGNAGERMTAFAIDLFIIMLILIAVTLATVMAGVSTRSVEVTAILWLVSFFLLRNFYFTYFEMGRHAATPGKRILGLRVAARDGGRLRGEAVFVRNAVRELELFLPLSFSGMATNYTVDAWIGIAGLIWGMIFMLFPIFNKDRLRTGDLAAGTWVVKVPKQVLAPDLLSLTTEKTDLIDHQPPAIFEISALEAYGVKELQVLEDILRSPKEETVKLVSERIRNKISVSLTDGETDILFLQRYYAALRNHLEKRMLMGRRRRDKFDIE